MNKNILIAAAALAVGAGMISCGKSADDNTLSQEWNFDTAEGWNYYSQDTATIEQWNITDGILAISTRANTYDRSKMETVDRHYAAGTYQWRTFIPEIVPGDQVSIGSWIYHDDHHELDFEVGYGQAAAREQAGAAADELVACMTNQDNPYHSGYVAIKPGWHDFEIRLDVRDDGNYTAVWSIDGEEKQRLELTFGPEYGFKVMCSVENLKFIGDTIPTADYTGLYDRVSFQGTKAIESAEKQD